MKRTPTLFRLIASLALIFSVVAVTAPATSAQNGSSIEIRNLICPPDYDGTNFEGDCVTAPDPSLPFTLSNGVERDGETDADGFVFFGDLPADTYTIIGGAPGHAADLVVFCSDVADGSEIEATNLNGGIEIVVPPETDIFCSWYNIPPEAPAGSVEVLKRLCPPGYDGDTFFEDCDEPQADIQFSLDGQQQVTDASGSAPFADLTEGTYTITEDTLPGDVDYYVYCRLAADPDDEFDFDYVTAGPTGAGIELFVPADTDLICGWYNIPAEEPTSSVEVLKRLCPPGYTGDSFFENCEEPQADIQFSLDGLETSTDADGSALFFDLQEGTYTITEDSVPSGDLEGFVAYCRLAEDPDAALDFDYVSAGPTGAGIELFVPEDTDIICGWYNIPVEVEPTPTPVPPTPTPTPTPPPELGIHPVNIEAGRCPEPGEIIFNLTDIELPEGEEIGFPGPVAVAESFSTVNATIEDLTDEEHIVVVYLSSEEADTVIACGQIGGVPREEEDEEETEISVTNGIDDEQIGGFAIKLIEVDDSGFVGIADLTPTEENLIGTDVTVFLTLVDDDPDDAATAA